MINNDLLLVMPEIVLASMACVILLIDVFLAKSEGYTAEFAYHFSLLTLMVTGVVIAYGYVDSQVRIFNGAYIIDSFSTILKIFLCLLTIVAFIYARDYLRDKNLINGEYFVLSLFSVLGAMVLLSSGNFLTLYLGLELLSLPIYALLALYKPNPRCAEAAMKYFIMGALGSGMLLYGISLLYGITGSFDFSTITLHLVNEIPSLKLTLYFAIIFIISGVGFKFGLAPFHMWVPDVYEGAITSLTLFIGAVTKIGAFALAYRVIAEVLLRLGAEWGSLLLLMGTISVGLGSIAGIAQSNIKRLLAYSTIAHFGFVALGLGVVGQNDFTAVTFYTFSYVVMLLGALGVILVISYNGFEAEHFHDFDGLVFNSPGLAVLMAIFMLSMAGVPPTVGFYAKFLIIKDLISAGKIEIAVLALVFSVIAAFYYLRIIKGMFFNGAKNITVNYSDIFRAWPGNILLYANAAVIVLLGIFPGAIVYLCGQAVKYSAHLP